MFRRTQSTGTEDGTFPEIFDERPARSFCGARMGTRRMYIRKPRLRDTGQRDDAQVAIDEWKDSAERLMKQTLKVQIVCEAFARRALEHEERVRKIAKHDHHGTCPGQGFLSGKIPLC